MGLASRDLRLRLLALLAGAWLTVMGLSSHAQQAPAPPDPQKEARLEWFREAKYGLFIHWGLYAIPAGEWKGARVPGIGEWIMNRAKIPVREYEALASQFNPVKFDADAWVQLAQDAGMKYIVITSKHHDGFALFGSKVSRYNVVDATPFKRDILKELAAACAKRNMRLGFYYSQAQDWHEPNGAGNNWDFLPNDKKDFDQYLRDKAEPQVRELLTGYGPVALIWFDTPQLMTAGSVAAFHRPRAVAAAEHPDRRPPGRGGRLRQHRRQRHPWRETHGGVGDAGDHQSHLGLPERRCRLETARRDHLQARRHRQQGRQLPAERRPDGRRGDPAGEPGRAARGGPVAEGERRGRLRRHADAVRGGAGGAEREGHEGSARRRRCSSSGTSTA